MIRLFYPEPTQEEVNLASQQVMEAGVMARGEQIEQFEQTLSEVTGIEHAIAVSNGTAALHLAVKAIGWNPGDKILTSPYSFIATSNAIHYVGAEPVFGCVDENFQLDLAHARSLLETNPGIKGILLPSIFGSRADTDNLRKLRQDFPHITVVEDASQALATSSLGIKIGEYSDIVTYSFHENKVITTLGEGGAALTKNAEIAEIMRRMREHGRREDANWIDNIGLGYNYRITEVQAAVGTLQLGRLTSILRLREDLAGALTKRLEGSDLLLPPEGPRSWFGFYVVADTDQHAFDLAANLKIDGVESRAQPMPALNIFAHNRNLTAYDNDLPNKAARVVMLPLHTRLQPEDIDTISQAVQKYSRKSQAPIVASAGYYDHVAREFSDIRKSRQEYLDAVELQIIKTLKTAELRNGKFIDIGCGDGARSLRIAEHTQIDLDAIDSSCAMVELARQNGVNAHHQDIVDVMGPEEYYDGVLMLWNVLGHIQAADRTTALKNIWKATKSGGMLFIDVNNMFNASQYGAENAQRNRRLVDTNPGDTSIGDFVAAHSIDGSEVATATHVFHTDEVINLLEQVGFIVEEYRYIDYKTGQETDESSGQIFLIARKPRE